MKSRRIWQCKTRHDHAQFTLKTGTIFEDSPISLDKWLLAMWMLANCKNGVSSYEISRATGISQKSTWFMLQRIRLALQDENTGGKLSGEVDFQAGDGLAVHRPGYHQRVRVPDRADQLDAEPLDIETRGETIQYLDIAVVAGACAYVKDPDRFSERF